MTQENIYEQLAQFTGNPKQLADYLIQKNENSKKYYGGNLENHNAVKEWLLAQSYADLSAMYQDTLQPMFVTIHGEKIANMMAKIVERSVLYTPSRSYYRRSFRTHNIETHINNFLDVAEMLVFDWQSFDLLDHMQKEFQPDYNLRPKEHIDSYLYASLIAYEIDQNNESIIQFLRDLCLSDNNTQILKYPAIIAISRCHNESLHQLLIDLLLAAKLQEGLRQSILENSDTGNLAFFKRMLNTVLEHNLLRFSSAVRAVAVWMGLEVAADHKRIIEKLGKLAHEYLNDEAARDTALASDDALELFVSLWATATQEMTAVLPIVQQLCANGETYQKQVALYFLSQLDNETLKLSTSATLLNSEDPKLLPIIHGIYQPGHYYGYYDKERFFEQVRALHYLKDQATRNRDFAHLEATLLALPKDGYQLSQVPFEWCNYIVKSEHIYKKMFIIASYDCDAKKIQSLMAHAKLGDGDDRGALVRFLLTDFTDAKQREFLFASLKDRSMQVRINALEHIKDLTLSNDEYALLMDLLSLKTPEIRKNIIEIILKTEAIQRIDLLKALLSDKVENRRLAGLDILLALKKDKTVTETEITDLLTLLPKSTEKEQVLIQTLQAGESEDYSKDNGFGIYDAKEFPDLKPDLTIHNPNLWAELHAISAERIETLLTSMMQLIAEHKDYQYKGKTHYSDPFDVVLGSDNYLRYRADAPMFTDPNYDDKAPENHDIDNFVIPEVWKTWFTDNKVTLLEHYLLVNFNNFANPSYLSYHYSRYEPWVLEYTTRYFRMPKTVQNLYQSLNNEDHYYLALHIIDCLWDLHTSEDRFAMIHDLLAILLKEIPADDWQREVYTEPTVDWNTKEQRLTLLIDVNDFDHLLQQLNNQAITDEDFTAYVALDMYLANMKDMFYLNLPIESVARAYDLGIFKESAIYRTFCIGSGRDFGNFTLPANKLYRNAQDTAKKYPFLSEFAKKLAQHVINIEVKRGDLPTPVSSLATDIRQHEGIENFVNILLGLGKDTLTRGWISSYNSGKKDVLSSLLRASVPRETDTAEALKDAVNGRIDDQRLLEAALYSPSWLPIVAKLLSWKGLESAAWYFHAHVNESISDEKMAVITRYSPISKESFNDGAFDVDWFNDAYKTLGKERFELLYDCAKYITSGANHRRAQLFADATLGQLKATKAFEKEINDKRSKDKLLSYSLIPLGKKSQEEALKRYDFLQAFLKASKKFGAQRRASEAKATEIALENLARNAGYQDTLRFGWQMETLKIQGLTEYFAPKTLETVELFIQIDEEGIASLICQKDGKELSAIPAKLRKNEVIVEYKALVADLKEQYRRAKASLELTMTRSDQFTAEELTLLQSHPVISPLLAKLLFVTDAEKIVIFMDALKLDAKVQLRIAHPYHLYHAKEWLNFQCYAFENQLIQPFKQIFRELYLINNDEKDGKTASERYAGHQIQPQKTLALLKTRGWSVDERHGLQRVYYRENIIAVLYAQADWFSPADIEAPTLETIQFYDRKTGERLELTKVPPIIFSEVMRDIDLVVSIAHVGGVDPEASHSTIEMRAAIVRELLPLLKLDNVKVDGNFAFIKGTLGEYTVHLGSAGIQQVGKGAINILAVQSQHRGKIFLPFADEDPRTAEIISKILLLADDQKIKDPSILEQIS